MFVRQQKLGFNLFQLGRGRFTVQSSLHSTGNGGGGIRPRSPERLKTRLQAANVPTSGVSWRLGVASFPCVEMQVFRSGVLSSRVSFCIPQGLAASRCPVTPLPYVLVYNERLGMPESECLGLSDLASRCSRGQVDNSVCCERHRWSWVCPSSW